MHKPVLIGMNNPLTRRPEFALWPSPPGCTGNRIWKMLAARTGATEEQYLAAFERRNLQNARTWTATDARACAEKLLPELRGRVVVLLGVEVRRAFGVPPMLVHPQTIHGVTWRQLPHPSGRCHWYNAPKNRRVAELLLAELYEEYTRSAA